MLKIGRSPEWAVAQHFAESRGFFLRPIDPDKPNKLVHPFGHSEGGTAFVYDEDGDFIWDRHAQNRKVTPARFLARCLGISEENAFRIIQRQLRTTIDWGEFGASVVSHKALPPASKPIARTSPVKAENPCTNGSLITFNEHKPFRMRVNLLTDFVFALSNNSVQPSQIELEWVRGRCWPRSWAQSHFRTHIFLGQNPKELMERIANLLGWNDEKRIASTLWSRGRDGKPAPFWWGNDYRILFPLWMPLQVAPKVEWIVTGYRIRRVTPAVPGGPGKEMQCTIKHIPELKGYPSQVGYFGLFRENSPSEDRIDGARGYTIILTEGLSDMFAGRRLLALDMQNLVGKEPVAFVTAGSISENTRQFNLPWLRNANRIIVAYNDDSVKGGTTGQKSAIKAKAKLLAAGLPAEILPQEALEGLNDLNDLLKKRVSDGVRCDSLFARYIMGGGS